MSINQRSEGVAEKEEVVDEIKNYFNCRYISPCEAVWRIFGYDIHYRNPPVQRLSFHLLGEDEHYYDDDQSIQRVVDEADNRKSMFTAWMECNEKFPQARNLLYTEFPNKFVWDGYNRIWTIRQRGFSIGRIDYVPPGVGEPYYLSLMLHYSRGPTSHEEIRTINNVVYPDFKSACYSLGILGDDKEYIEGINEASFWALPNFLRRLFASLLLSGSVSRPEYLWENTWRLLGDDILRRQRKELGIQDLQLTDEEIKNFTLVELEKIFHTNGKSLQNFPNMPLPDNDLIKDSTNKLIQQELNFDRFVQNSEHNKLFSSLTEEQKMIYQIIISSTSDVHGGFYFVYGYGGTGKTYVWRTLSAALRSKGHEIVLNVASSGVAALLLPSGRTTHSRFGISLTITEGSFCKIEPGTELAALLLNAKLIIWDEAPMMSRFCLEALDRSLKDISPNEKKLNPFAGKTVVLGGDFRKILPVIPMGTREDIVYASICSSGLWDHCQILRLTKNMRLSVGQMLSPSFAEEIKQFSDWMLQIGEGRIGTEIHGETIIDLPEDLIIRTTDDHVAAIVESTYPNLLEKFQIVHTLKRGPFFLLQITLFTR